MNGHGAILIICCGLEIRERSNPVVAFPLAPGHENITQEDARHRARREFGGRIPSGRGLEVHKCPKRDVRTGKAATAKTPFPCRLDGLAVRTVDVARQREVPHGMRPPALGKACVKQNGASAFDSCTHSTLRDTIRVGPARGGRGMIPTKVLGSAQQLRRVVGVEAGHGLTPGKVG